MGDIVEDSFDVEVYDGPLAVGGFEEGDVGGVVVEEVFGEDGGSAGVLQDVEAGFKVGVAVGVVGAEGVAGEPELGGGIEAVGQLVTGCLSSGGVGAPASGGHPAVAHAGGGGVDGNKDGRLGDGVGAAYPLREGGCRSVRG